MTTYANYYSSYDLEHKRRREEWEQVPKECPHCNAPINQKFDEYSNKGPRYHCGKDKCRKAASRAGIAERKRQERKDARARVLVYCEQHLDRTEKTAIMNMCDMLMQYSQDEGHQIAEQVIQVIESLRCKHDRISQLEENAAIWKRRALKSEEQLQDRIAELEEELRLFNALESTIHSIAQRQQLRQPDQPPQQELPRQAAAPEPEEEADPD